MSKLLYTLPCSPPRTLTDIKGDADLQAKLTPTLRFLFDYGHRIDNQLYRQSTAQRYYSKDVVFHNQNNAEYHGAAQMWPWIDSLFSVFSRVQHTIVSIMDIEQDSPEEVRKGEKENLLVIQMERKLWVRKGGKDEVDTDGEPDVSIPTCWIGRVGRADEGFDGACENRQWREVWLYWDTALLSPFLKKEETVFSQKNIVESGKSV